MAGIPVHTITGGGPLMRFVSCRSFITCESDYLRSCASLVGTPLVPKMQGIGLEGTSR